MADSARRIGQARHQRNRDSSSSRIPRWRTRTRPPSTRRRRHPTRTPLGTPPVSALSTSGSPFSSVSSPFAHSANSANWPFMNSGSPFANSAEDEEAEEDPAAPTAPRILRAHHLPRAAFALTSTTQAPRTVPPLLNPQPQPHPAHAHLVLHKPDAPDGGTAAFNSFFDAFRQNAELAGGITERIPSHLLRHVWRRISELLLHWLRETARHAASLDALGVRARPSGIRTLDYPWAALSHLNDPHTIFHGFSRITYLELPLGPFLPTATRPRRRPDRSRTTDLHTLLHSKDLLGPLRWALGGPFRPEAQVYESVSHIETDVVFGIDLRRWAEGGWDAVSSGEQRKHDVPLVVTALLSALTAAYARLPNNIEKRKSWIYEVPLPAVHHLREALNAVPLDEPMPPEIFAPYDAPVIAGTIKLWLLKLDPPIALWEGWDEIRKIYPAVGAAAKSEGEDAEAQRITDLGTALQRLPRVHLYVLNAVVSHLRKLIDTTTVEETVEVYTTKLALSVGRTIIRPKFESELSIQDRHPICKCTCSSLISTRTMRPLSLDWEERGRAGVSAEEQGQLERERAAREKDSIAPIVIKQRSPPPAFSVTSRPAHAQSRSLSAYGDLGVHQRSSTLVPVSTASVAPAASSFGGSNRLGTSNANSNFNSSNSISTSNKSNSNLHANSAATSTSSGSVVGDVRSSGSSTVRTRPRSSTMMPLVTAPAPSASPPTCISPLNNLPVRPFAALRMERNSPASSTGDSSSRPALLTPRDGSDFGSGASRGSAPQEEMWIRSGGMSGLVPVGATGRQIAAQRRSVSFDFDEDLAGDGKGKAKAKAKPREMPVQEEERRRERRRSEARAAIELGNVRHRNPQLEHRNGFKTEELETQVWNAVQGDAFTYLALAVLQLERKRGSSPTASFANTLTLSPEQQEQREIPSEDFIPVVFSAFEILVRSLITHASSELRKIKQRQEDLVLASARTDRTRATPARFPSSIAPDAERPTALPRSDIGMLYSFIGLLYSALPPERALQFWGSTPHGDSHMTYLEYNESKMGRLPAFLQWAVWSTQVHDVAMSMALYDMLGGLANGQLRSELAYNFMVRATGEVIPGSSLPSSSASGPAVSWSVVFALLDSWAMSSSGGARGGQPPPSFGNTTMGMSGFNNTAPPPPQQPPQTVPIGPKEVLLAQSFLHLLSTVISHSVAVRIAISGHAQFRAIPTLVSLIPLGIPLELKGALFDTLAAFCQPGAGDLQGRLDADGASRSHQRVEMELDEIEALHRMYPATIPFLRLLSTLLHTPKRIVLKDRVVDSGIINTIPEALGQPYRLPGIGPFITFVINNVFTNIPNREYLQPSDRWQTNDLCLCFIERALASFDLESLVRASDDSQLKDDATVALLVHLGYEIVKRLLTNSPLQSSILTYVVEGLAGFEKGLADEEPYFASTIVRVLRITLRVLEIQDIFLNVLLPLLHEFDSTALIGTVHPRSYFIKFDQALSYGAQYAPALAAYVSFPSHPELVLLSVKILSALSFSSAFSSLYTLVERSDESDRIMAGFMRILGSESGADVLLAEQSTGAGAADENPNVNTAALQQAIRLAVLQLFIKNTEAGRPYPNIAHFFLFGDDPHALGAHGTCIHVILDLAKIGVPRLDARDDDAPDSDPLFMTLPGLAELLYRMVYQLCTHSRTSEFTMRYLRTCEDFFACQLAAIRSQVPFTTQKQGITVMYADGARVETTVPALSSFLRLHSWIFDLAALDLHVLTSKGHFKGVAKLLDILFGNDGNTYPGWQDGFREVGQSHLRIIEFAQSLAFDWADMLTVEPVELHFLGQLNLHSCVRKDANGCEIIDRTALLSLLTVARRMLHAQNSVVTPAQGDQLNAETTYILESCAVENHRREVAHAQSAGYESWKRLLDTKCFHRLPHDHRENMLFDLLHVLPTILRSQDIQESTAVLLSEAVLLFEAVLSSVTKLREDRRHQVLVQAASGDADAGTLPAERLYAILRNILECVVENNRVELVRGNLYAVLINYVHLITTSSEDHSDRQDHQAPGLTMSLAASTTRDDFLFNETQALVPVSQAGRPHSAATSLELGSLALMKSVMERLVATISRDAINGSEVWKTVAFTLLDSLVQLSGLEKQHIVLSALVRHGILTNFVRGIKESDLRLQSVLKPDPDDLNPLYVYEAKMSLFVRMAQTRLGAERLLEAQLIPVLSQCDYLDARPEADQSFMDQDSFLPSAIHRYHQLFMPALQLVDGMLATLGTKHATVSNQALDFLSSHSTTVVILLKNDTEQIPLALVEEMHLLMSLCAGVLPHVPNSELLSPHSGFGAIHAAVLALATKSLGTARWLADVTPQTDAEMLSTSVLALGHGSDTKFDVSKRQKERMMRKSVVEYIGAASDFLSLRRSRGSRRCTRTSTKANVSSTSSIMCFFTTDTFSSE
ncbi:hypothetical protein B0H11DRAFT_2349435 [Mycena galericulata]|nr:hypothetical protein B0H11DRAFT_2349435 [Mycena galericulata]